ERGGDDAVDAGGEQGFGARWGAAVVVAWFQRDVDGGTARAIARGGQGGHLGVRSTGAGVPAFADDLAVLDHHATDERVGRDAAAATLRQRQRQPHERGVAGREGFEFGIRGYLHERRAGPRTARAHLLLSSGLSPSVPASHRFGPAGAG